MTTEELFGKADDWMRNFERDMDADRSRIQRLKEKVLTPGELYILSLEQPRITAWDVYNVATEIYKPGKTDFPAMIPQNGAMADFLLSYNQN